MPTVKTPSTYKPNFKTIVYTILFFLTGYLIYQELALFLAIPIHSSKFKRSLSPEQIPDFLVCHIPGFNFNQLHTHGYKKSYDYHKGIIWNTGKRGWNGNDTDWSIEKMQENVSVISTSKDCPVFEIRSGKIFFNATI